MPVQTEPVTIKATLPIATIDLYSILCTAIEGGSNFWMDAYAPRVSRIGDRDLCNMTDQQRDDFRLLPQHISLTRPQGADEFDEPVKVAEIGLEQVAQAISAIWGSPDRFPGTCRDLIANFPDIGGIDACSADVVLQVAVFGQEVYG